MRTHQSFFLIGVTIILFNCFLTHCLAESYEDDEDSIQLEPLSQEISFVQTYLRAFTTNFRALASSSYNKYYVLHVFYNNLVSLCTKYMQATAVLTRVKQSSLNEGNSKVVESLIKELKTFDKALSSVEKRITDDVHDDSLEIKTNFYGENFRTIEDLYEDWVFSLNSDSPEKEDRNRGIFLRQYDIHYRRAAWDTLNKAAVFLVEEKERLTKGKEKNKYDCDGKRIRKVCAAVAKTIMRGLGVKGAYLAYMNLTHSMVDENLTWEKRLNILSEKCDDILNECQRQWKQRVIPIVNATYEQYKNTPNFDLASAIYHDLTSRWGQRAWFVFVYDAVTGYEYHAFATNIPLLFEEKILRWRENGKMLSILSMELREFPSFHNKPNVLEHLGYMKESVANCHTKKRKWKKQGGAGELLEFARESSRKTSLMTYAVRENLHLGFVGTPGRYTSMKISFPKKCENYAGEEFLLYAIG